MSHEEENKKIIQLLVLKGFVTLKKIDEELPHYNEFFDGALLEWLQNKKIVDATQAQEIRKSLVDADQGKTISATPPSSETLHINTPPHSKDSETFARITQLPRTLGSYQILEKLGEGGMGKVFKAKHLFLEKWVAFKVLNERLLQNQKFIARFFREAKSAGALNHPNIVRCLDAGVIEGIHYLAMEFVEGKTVASILRERKLAPEESLHIVLKILSALEHAQTHAMIHRDLKPDNIMLSREGEVKLLDFGLAKTLGDSSLTLDGAILGTPYYMSPEQARGESEVTITADIYALGATLFHMLTGEVPYPGDSPLKIIRQHLDEPPPSLRLKLPPLDPRLDALIEKMMAKRPQNRYQTPGDARFAILHILSTPYTPVPPPSKENPLWDEKTVYLESPNANAKTQEWQEPPPTQKFKVVPPSKNSSSTSSLAQTLQQASNSSTAPLPAPSTSKFTLPKTHEPKNPSSTKLAPPISNQATFTYKATDSEKKLPSEAPKVQASTEEVLPEMEEESFVAPFPNAKKKEPQASGFVPGSQMYHGNWKPPSSSNLKAPQLSSRSKKKKNLLFIGFGILLVVGALVGTFYPEELQGYWNLASNSFYDAKCWVTQLFETKETFNIEISKPDPLEIDTKKLPKEQLDLLENIYQLKQKQPVPYKEIYKEYQTLFKQFPQAELTVKKEWEDFVRYYEKKAQSEFQQMESQDFIAKNLFLFEESVERWNTYSDTFEPLSQFHRMGKEQSKQFQELSLSAEKKIYYLLNKGLESVWKTREDFERDWQKTAGDIKNYQVSQTTLLIDLDKRAKDLVLLYKKLFPLHYLITFKANIKSKGFEFLLHHTNTNSFNSKLFSKENLLFSDSQWYSFRFHVKGRLLKWYIFIQDKENKYYTLFAQGEEHFKSSAPEQGQWGFKFPSGSSCNFEDMRYLKPLQK